MKIAVGSTNPCKLEAVRETLNLYPGFAKAEIIGQEVQSGVSDQPSSIDEMVWGAMNRAGNARGLCQEYALGIGLESGFHYFPLAGYMELSVCAIYDGNQYHFGFSPAFKCPEAVQKLMVQEKITLNDACYRSGLTSNLEIGKSEGIIGILTKNRKTRKDYTKDAVIMALIPVENKF